MSTGEYVVCKKRFLKIISANDQHSRVSHDPVIPPPSVQHSCLKRRVLTSCPLLSYPNDLSDIYPKAFLLVLGNCGFPGPHGLALSLLHHLCPYLEPSAVCDPDDHPTLLRLSHTLLLSSNFLLPLFIFSCRSSSPEADSSMKSRVPNVY